MTHSTITSHPVIAQSPAPVYVILWFDTEDYILPQSDTAAKRLAEALTRLGVRATFKVVGEKARTLERRGRKDVIAALKKHEIGYHSNTHSQQPTVAVYLQHAGWEDGAAEFYRREIQGVRDIERIFGVTPSCYGQPGAAWASQAFPALKRMGIGMYLDESDHVGIGDQPFYYGGMLNVFKMRSNLARMELKGGESLTEGKAKFQAAYDRLRAQGGGAISIYYHPCEWVHTEFWDGVNFRRGANPPRGEWKLPGTRPAPETEAAFNDFEQYVKFIKEQPGARFVTATELMKIYADGALTHNFTPDEIRTIAQSVQREITFLKMNGFTLSPADSFSLLTEAYLSLNEEKRPVKLNPVYGPAHQFESSAGGGKLVSAKRGEFYDSVLQTSQFLRASRRMPDEIWIGASSVSPQDYLATLGAEIEGWKNANDSQGKIVLRQGNFTADRYVADDSPQLWGWVIFPEGFHAPKIIELAKLQAWTLKPAILQK
ncbi:MAG TPA: polysaccharide deacetylase family protein [Blastocatellia bacterium]|nr:polysaccharide deacetylase family protein [Blastocatellia bacterium]